MRPGADTCPACTGLQGPPLLLSPPRKVCAHVCIQLKPWASSESQEPRFCPAVSPGPRLTTIGSSCWAALLQVGACAPATACRLRPLCHIPSHSPLQAPGGYTAGWGRQRLSYENKSLLFLCLLSPKRGRDRREDAAHPTQVNCRQTELIL